MNFKRFLLFPLLLVFIGFGNKIFAQNTLFIQAPASPDSSFYDIIKVQKNEYWICGEHGILKSVDSLGIITDIHGFPGKDNNLLKMLKLSDRILISGDKGYIYTFFFSSKKWKTLHIPSLKRRSIYSLLSLGDSIIYACGGNMPIAKGKRAIPRGFVYISTDQGESWRQVINKWNRFFWDMAYNPEQHNVAALGYSPLGSRIFEIKNDDFQKSAMHTKLLLHDIEYAPEQGLLACGGQYKKSGGKGKIYWFNQKKTIDFESGGFIWSLIFDQQLKLLTAGPGTIHFTTPGSKQWQSKQILSPGNFYQSVKISDRKVFIIGSGGLLLQITLP